MVSGSLLLPRNPGNEIKDTLSRIIFRLGLPLVFWASVYFWWEYHYYGRLIYPDQAVYLFFTGSIFSPIFLGYFIGLISLLAFMESFY